ncbi:WhiB family transcriptional regulator [Nonomuraea africana]|uniref:Transcriptional regulator WhiB n=1 Tax=Nonomuraea africana TaxID=46171 RepID=A0ABR9KF84_9ACTN|nr:WhiB family transcriptional regulator [Nonomuraea africana]MBE1560678.1 WhiB family redox-sensing transcriptional regulator [Nonomuraea africana]
MFILDRSRRAACLDEDPEIFFPISLEGAGQAQVEHAKSICGGCSVRAACLDYALSTRQTDGVWGGTTPTERRTLLPLAS